MATERSLTSRELQRLIFDREIAIGAVGMTQADIKSVPEVGEADVFRSLQAFAACRASTTTTVSSTREAATATK